MKKLVIVILLVSVGNIVFANNLKMTTPVFTAGTNTLTFTISWDNSWKLATGPSNWDAVWVFVKRQTPNPSAGNPWVHAILSSNSSDHSATNAAGPAVTIDAVADGMGVFIHRTYSGIGNVLSQNITIKLSGSNNPSITPTANDNFQVFGIEMVYVPQGQFYIGDGRPTNTNNFNVGTSSPVLITAAIQTSGLGAASTYCSSAIYGCPNSLPGSFPLGYNGFYCMKYEITQQQIVDFLNTLTYAQQYQKVCTAWGITNRNSLLVTGQYFDGNSYGFTIYNSVAAVPPLQPAVFTSNRPLLPEGYLTWQDLTSYLDWSGLRPMTEFEFEKACRGTINPVPLEYPWGNTMITDPQGTFNNSGLLQSWNNQQYDSVTTMYNNQIYDGLCNSQYSAGWGWNPFRGGFAATSLTNRSQAAATYYGIMEMGGNMFEQCVGGAGFDYSGFTNANGNALLTNTGLANITGWPQDGGVSSGTILRGGSGWTGGVNCCGSSFYNPQVQTSDRTYYAGTTWNISLNANGGKTNSVGGRGVRTF